MLYVLFGSQSGNAEDVAENIWRSARRRDLEVQLWGLDQIQLLDLAEKPCHIVFVVSTTGQGDEPDNMKECWRGLLRRSLASDCFSQVQFAVLGLGDSNYRKFNFAAKKLYRRLIQLGASPFVELGLADDQHDLGLDAEAVPWTQSLWDTLAPCLQVDETKLLPPKFSIEWIPNCFKEPDEESRVQFAAGQPFQFVKLVKNDRQTAADHYQDTRLLQFDIDQLSSFDYNPGDVLTIQPSNLQETIDQFVEIMQLGDKLNDRLRIAANSAHTNLPSILPSDCSVNYLLHHYWDLQAVPRRSFFAQLACFAPNEMQKERLVELSSAGDQEDLFDYVNRPRRTIVETLRDFADTAHRLPFEYLLDLIGPIRPRSFSIASCRESQGRTLQLLMAVVQYRTKLSAPRMGLCSNYLARCKPGCWIPAYVNKGTLRFPTSLNIPCILVGPGTGIAPLRSFLWWRRAQLDQDIQNSPQKDLLFFGARNRKGDFYFEDEWKKLNITLNTAFSRDQTEKCYVQHRILEKAKLVGDLLVNQNACVFVCGNAKQMPDDITDALKQVVKHLVVDSEQYLEQLLKQNRIQFETW